MKFRKVMIDIAFRLLLPPPVLTGSGSMGFSQLQNTKHPRETTSVYMVARLGQRKRAVKQNNTIKYEKPLLLVGGGDVNWPVLLSLIDKGHPLVAADGGANALADYGVTPDMIIGDLDSIDLKTRQDNHAHLLEISEQQTTDFEKTLYATDAPLYLAFGFLGRRYDHCLAALHSLVKYREQKQIILVDLVDMIWTPPSTEKFEIDLPLGTRFSIYPLEPVTFETSQGLEYPLDGLSLKQGVAIGTSNRVTGETVRIRQTDSENGAWAVIIPNDFIGLFTA